MKLVPDTSVVIDGRITSMIKKGEYAGATIIIPEAVVAELESQANQGREIGFSGLTELQQLCRMAEQKLIEIQFVGVRPTLEQVKLASGGEIDAMIRNVAIEHNARFITSDSVQSEVARAKGLDVQYMKPQISDFTPLGIDQYFDEQTLAVYLKERVPPYARKGTITEKRLVRIRDQPSSEYELIGLAREILERAKRDPDGFVESEGRGITVVQIGSMRIAIARRPFSDGMEITAVRPVVDISLENYRKAQLVKNRLADEKRGVLLAGEPGAGKTTLVQNIAIYLSDRGSVVKTMEAPRDMQVPDQITQYTALDGSMEKTAEMLLLLRPDYVIYDELRKHEDFQIFSDMRLTGVGMIGVLHAEGVHAALQRFSDRVDFGVLSQVVNSIIFVSAGDIRSIYDLSFGLKVPVSMPAETRPLPVITVTDAESGRPVLEVFRSEGETVILPVNLGAAPVHEKTPEQVVPLERIEEPVLEEVELQPDVPEEKPAWRMVAKDIQREIGRYTEGPVEVKMISDSKAVVYIEDKDVPAAIGKGGKNVASIVNKVGVGIDIRPLAELEVARPVVVDSPVVSPAVVEGLPVEGGIRIRTDKKHLAIISSEQSGKIVDVFAGKEYLFTATVSDAGEIHLVKSSTIAQEMLKRYTSGETIRMRPV